MADIFERGRAPTPEEFAERQRRLALAAGVSEPELGEAAEQKIEATGGTDYLPERRVMLASLAYARMAREVGKETEA